MTSPNITKFLTALDEFLVESFEVVEFMRVVERTFGTAVSADLPSLADSPRSFIFHAVRVLARRGLLEGQFFAALARERPHRRDEIRRLAENLRISVLPDGPDAETVVWRGSASQTTEGFRQVWVESLERLLLTRERMDLGENRRSDVESAIDGLARRLRSSPLPTSGTILAGTVLDRALGTGNFGTVWRARHLQTSQIVATKVFNLDRLTDGVMLWRFRRSIRALQTLNQHRDAPPSIPRVIDVAPDTLSFAMPYFAEGTLEQLSRRGWSLATKIEIFLEVCRAVAFAHRIGVIHRDIKPANVLLDETLRPVLVDYDIADIRFVTELSVAAGGLGTPVFAAPEQLEHAEDADERSDIYSLGRLFYYMLLERSPGYQIERDPSLENLRGLQPALIAVVRRATQWDPRRRHGTVRELIADIERHRSGLAAIKARCANAGRWIRNHAALLTTGVAVTGASIAIAAQQYQAAESHARVIANATAIQAQIRDSLREVARAERDLREFDHALMNLKNALAALYGDLRDHPEGSIFRGALGDLADRSRALNENFISLASDLESSMMALQNDHAELDRALGISQAPAGVGVDASERSRDRLPNTQQAEKELLGQIEGSTSNLLVAAELQARTSENVDALERVPTTTEPRHLPITRAGPTPASSLRVRSLFITPELERCTAADPFLDKARHLDITVSVRPDGTLLRWEANRMIGNSLSLCIETVLRDARFQASPKGDKLVFIIIQ